MKRIFAAVLALCLCVAGAAMAEEGAGEWAAGDTVVFGSYEQDNDLTNGKEPLEWIVLKTEEGRAMLITRYLIDARAYHKAFVNMTWSECTLRQWLNDTFLTEAFSQEEQARIQEVLVVNDGSTDSSPQVIEDYVRRFPDRFAQLNKPNGGLSDARNFAIGKAEGEWIAFLDSDDWADPEYYAKMADVMARGADVVVSDIEYFYENGQPSWIMPGLNPHAFDSPVKQAFLSPMFAWNKLYRADFFTQKHYRYPVGTWYEDIPVTIPIFAQSQTIGIQHEARIHYRQREGSIMSVTKSERLKEIFPVMKQVRDQFAEMGLSERYHDELEYLHIEHLRLYGMFRFLRSPLTSELKAMSDVVMAEFYPNWKKNPYIRNLGWKDQLFLKTFGSLTLPLYKHVIH